MWDTAIEPAAPAGTHLSRDLPCQRCGHASPTYLPCGDDCDCAVVRLPGQLVAA